MKMFQKPHISHEIFPWEVHVVFCKVGKPEDTIAANLAELQISAHLWGNIITKKNIQYVIIENNIND